MRSIALAALTLLLAGTMPMPASAQHHPHHPHLGPGPHGGHGGAHGHSSRSTLDLVEQLRSGGHVIFIRHEHTELDALPGGESTDFPASEGQRNLSPVGRESARMLGKAFAMLEIPVGTVLASPYCRSRHTAELAFGRARVEHDLIGIPGNHGRSMNDMATALVRLTREHAKPGPNAVLVGHFHQLLDLHAIHLQEGEAAILLPDRDTVAVRGRVLSVQWGDIIRDLRRMSAGAKPR